MNGWWIVAQVFGLITICFEFWAYQIKEKRKFFVVTGTGSIFWTLMFVSIGIATGMTTQFSTIIAGGFGVIRCAVFFWIYGDPKRKKLGRIILLCFVAIAVVAGYLAISAVFRYYPETAWIHLVGLFAAVGFIVGQYLPGKHPVRIAVVFYATMVILTQTPLNIMHPDPLTGLRWNIMGIAIEIAKIIAVIVFYVMLMRRSYMIKKLKEIKAIIAAEVDRIGTSDVTLAQVASGMESTKLEKLTAKMLRYEIAAIERSEITNITTCENAMATVASDARQVQDVKDLIARVIKYKEHKTEETNVPRMGNQKSVQATLTGKEKKEEPEALPEEQK